MNLIVELCLNFAIVVMSSHLTYSREAKVRCQMERVHNMLAYNCADMKLNEIPKYLKDKTEVEVLNERLNDGINLTCSYFFRSWMHRRIEYED